MFVSQLSSNKVNVDSKQKQCLPRVYTEVLRPMTTTFDSKLHATMRSTVRPEREGARVSSKVDLAPATRPPKSLSRKIVMGRL